jgi:hydroxyquinol 1,2-dioxygenase
MDAARNELRNDQFMTEQDVDDDTRGQSEREAALTAEVVASFANTPDSRLRELMQSLVKHLHGFARDVRLSQDEWNAVIAFLTRAGHITDEHRQEFVLLSDVLGLSMLTVAMNHPKQGDATESTVFGPFFVEAAPLFQNGDDLSGALTGRPCHVHGSVAAVDGTPLAGARIEVWAADDEGFYDVQRPGAQLAGRGHLFTRDDGTYEFWTVQPSAYPIPHDGPVGDLLAASARSVMRPAHIHFMVSHEGFDTLITHVFVAGDEWLGDDAVFGVKESLIMPFVQHAAAGREWSEVVFHIRLAPAPAGAVASERKP